MMMRACVVLVISALASCAFASTSMAERIQVECSVDNRFVGFEVKEQSDAWNPKAQRYMIDVQKGGPTIRLPPMFYAPAWEDVINMTYQDIPNNNIVGSIGILSFRIRDAVVGSYEEEIGIVQLSCWRAALAFIRQNGISVHTVELTKDKGDKSNALGLVRIRS